LSGNGHGRWWKTAVNRSPARWMQSDQSRSGLAIDGRRLTRVGAQPSAACPRPVPIRSRTPLHGMRSPIPTSPRLSLGTCAREKPRPSSSTLTTTDRSRRASARAGGRPRNEEARQVSLQVSHEDRDTEQAPHGRFIAGPRSGSSRGDPRWSRRGGGAHSRGPRGTAARPGGTGRAGPSHATDVVIVGGRGLRGFVWSPTVCPREGDADGS